MRVLILAVTALAALTATPAHAHDVKDPVCRMTVDSDTTKFKHKLGSKTFYFCSKQCRTSFAGAPAKYEALAAQLSATAGRDYTVALQTSPARSVAGEPVTMTFAIRTADSGDLVREFETIHERWLHLLMVTEDLAWFEHQHPARGADGLFRLTWRFPRPGRYRLYADFTPADGDNQVKPIDLTVGGARRGSCLSGRTRSASSGSATTGLRSKWGRSRSRWRRRPCSLTPSATGEAVPSETCSRSSARRDT